LVDLASDVWLFSLWKQVNIAPLLSVIRRLGVEGAGAVRHVPRRHDDTAQWEPDCGPKVHQAETWLDGSSVRLAIKGLCFKDLRIAILA
jgi:hypothetical protein